MRGHGFLTGTIDTATECDMVIAVSNARKGKRKSVRIGRGRAAVIGYETGRVTVLRDGKTRE